MHELFLLKTSLKIPQKNILLCLLILMLMTAAGCSKHSSFETINPEDAGFSSEELKKVSIFAEKIGTGAITVLYDGKLLYSWGDTSINRPCHSIRKPFLGALFGKYISIEDKKIININSTLEELEIDDIPPGLSEAEKKASVRDLLMSRSGVYHAAAAESETMKRLRPARGSHPPGTSFTTTTGISMHWERFLKKLQEKNLYIL